MQVVSSDKDPKSEIGDHMRITKEKNVFAKGYIPNWSEEGFLIKKVKNTVPWTYVIEDLHGEQIFGKIYEKKLQKIDQTEFRIKNVTRKKGYKWYVKWKGYDNSFNSWFNKNDVVI